MKQYAFPQYFHVHPREAHEEDHEPILGVGAEPCCSNCAHGMPCAGEACSQPKAPPSIPGSTSFPVGFGQANAPITTTSVPVATVSSWVVPIGIALAAAAAGFGLAYVIKK